MNAVEPIPITVSDPGNRGTILNVLSEIEKEQAMSLNLLNSIYRSFGFEEEKDTVPDRPETTRDRIDDVLTRMRIIRKMLGKISAEVF